MIVSKMLPNKHKQMAAHLMIPDLHGKAAKMGQVTMPRLNQAKSPTKVSSPKNHQRIQKSHQGPATRSCSARTCGDSSTFASWPQRLRDSVFEGIWNGVMGHLGIRRGLVNGVTSSERAPLAFSCGQLVITRTQGCPVVQSWKLEMTREQGPQQQTGRVGLQKLM